TSPSCTTPARTPAPSSRSCSPSPGPPSTRPSSAHAQPTPPSLRSRSSPCGSGQLQEFRPALPMDPVPLFLTGRILKAVPVAGPLQLTHRGKGVGQIALGGQGVGVVGAEHPPAGAEVFLV